MSNKQNYTENAKKTEEAISMREKIARDNHTEIERKRRSKMAGYYQEMAEHVPACRSQSRKPDKLTIMKLAIEHITEMGNEGGRDSFLTDEELQHIIAQVVDGFLISVQLDSTVVTYVSSTCFDILGIPANDIFSSSLLNIVHPEDVSKVKEYLSSQIPQRRSVDLRSGTLRRDTRGDSLVNSRRMIICRIRCYNDQEHYCVVHITGVVTPTEEGLAIACLVRRFEPIEDDPQAMSTKYDSSGTITFIDAKMSELLGYRPQMMLGKSIIDFCHPEDRIRLKMSLDQAIELRGPPASVDCRLLAMDNTCVLFKMRHSAFVNPHTANFEFLVGCNYTYECPRFSDSSFDFYSQPFGYVIDHSLYYPQDSQYYQTFKNDPPYSQYGTVPPSVAAYDQSVQGHQCWGGFNEAPKEQHYNFNKHYE